MVFFMVSAQSFNSLIVTNTAVYWVLALVLILGVEINCLVGTGQGRQKMLSTVSGTIHTGILLLIALFLAMSVL
jgi:hypothetical protein